MKIALHCFLLLAWVVWSGQTNTRQEEEQSRIMTLENAWNQATLQRDAKAIGPLLAEEFIYIDYDGTLMNKAEYLASIRTADVHYEHVASEYMEVKFYEQSAMVVGVYREKGVKSGKPFLHRERFVDTWAKRNGTWTCVTSQSTLIAH